MRFLDLKLRNSSKNLKKIVLKLNDVIIGLKINILSLLNFKLKKMTLLYSKPENFPKNVEKLFKTGKICFKISKKIVLKLNDVTVGGKI